MMSSVVVPCYEQFAAAFDKRVEIFEGAIVEVEFVLKALWAGFAVGKINIEENEVVVVGGNNAPFIVEVWFIHAAQNLRRFLFTVDCRARIPWSLCGIEKAVVPLWFDHFLVELVSFGFDFLDAEGVGLLFVEPIQKAFALSCADTVYVPGDEFHGLMIAHFLCHATKIGVKFGR